MTSNERLQLGISIANIIDIHPSSRKVVAARIAHGMGFTSVERDELLEAVDTYMED